MPNIVLDLDETLIHTIVRNSIDPTLEQTASFKFQLGDSQHYYVFKRPGLKQFLETVFQKFKRVGIWTAAEAGYAKVIIKNILTCQQIVALDFVFSRNFCANDHIGRYKPLSKIYKLYASWRKEETIMLDNSAAVMRDNPENGIHAIDYAEPELEHDMYLDLLAELIDTKLPKVRVYQFVKEANQILPYVHSMYELQYN